MTETFLYRNNDGEIKMWPRHAFSELDLNILEGFLSERQVIPMIDYCEGLGGPDTNTVVMRHDVDHSIDHALKFAKWEHERGFRSTYFILHSAWYYSKPETFDKCREIRSLGHEIGFHNDSVGATFRIFDRFITHDCADVLRLAIKKFTHDFMFPVYGCADHGSGYIEHQAQFWQKYTPEDFGFRYEAYQLMNGHNYISDNGGRWRAPLVDKEGKQTHMLIHPAHWPVT